jgi:polyisoprenoid-binding protein YceI
LRGGLPFLLPVIYMGNIMSQFYSNGFWLKLCGSTIVILLLASCGYLIQPKITTGIVNLQPGTYSLDPQHCTVLFKLNHMGMSTFVGRFNQAEASLAFDPSKMEEATLSALITIASIDVNNKDLEEALRGKDWFDVPRYPQAQFTTKQVRVIDQTHAVFTGDLILHGVAAPLDLAVTFNGGGDNLLTGYYTIGFTATAHLKRSQFGIDYLIPAISDDVNIEVFAEFQKKH